MLRADVVAQQQDGPNTLLNPEVLENSGPDIQMFWHLCWFLQLHSKIELLLLQRQFNFLFLSKICPLQVVLGFVIWLV